MTTSEIGKIAEEVAFAEEVLGVRPEFKAKVRLVANDFAKGYDLESVDENNQLKVIEVKTWNRDGYFYCTENEVKVLTALREAAWVYLVDISKGRIVKKIQNPFKKSVNMEPILYRYFY
jgi:uncharacterized protein YjhX (UPF0386 family)